jgi:hypothetical protein
VELRIGKRPHLWNVLHGGAPTLERRRHRIVVADRMQSQGAERSVRRQLGHRLRLRIERFSTWGSYDERVLDDT